MKKILIIILTLISVCLYSNGIEDYSGPTLDDAKTFLANGFFDKAIESLIVIVKDDPEQIERAQKIILEIKEYQDQYNILLSKIVDLINKGQFEQAKILSKDLKKLQTFPNIDDHIVRIIIEKNINDVIFNKLFVKGNSYIDQGLYDQAIVSYLIGFDLYKDTFIQLKDSIAIAQIIETQPERIDLISQAYKYSGENIFNSIINLEKNINDWLKNYESSKQYFINQSKVLSNNNDWNLILSNAINSYNKEKQLVEKFTLDTNNLSNSYSILLSDLENIPEEFWTEYVLTLMNGKKENQGILDAIEKYNQNNYITITNAIEIELKDDFDILFQEYNQKYDIFDKKYQDVDIKVSIANKYFPNNYLTDSQKSLIALKILSNIDRNILTLNNLNNFDLKFFNTLISTTISQINQIEDIDSNNTAINIAMAETQMKIQDNFSSIITIAVNYDFDNMKKNLYDINYSEAASLINVSDGYVRRPKYARVNYIDNNINMIKSNIKNINDFISKYSKISNSVENKQVSYLLSEAYKLLKNYQVDNDNLFNLSNEANNYIKDSEKYLTVTRNSINDALKNISNAEQSFNKKNFEASIDYYDQAINNLDQAYESYGKAYSNDNDIAENSNFNNERRNLKDRINNSKENVSTVFARQTINTARDAYSNKNFNNAIILLNKSQKLWNEVHGKNNEELSLWIGRMENAIKAMAITEINEYDPIYSEINQYLNIANQYYKVGIKALSNNSKSADGVINFAAAKEIIAIIKGIYPNLTKVYILEKKIFKEEYPGLFSGEARKIINKAKLINSVNDGQKILPELYALNEIDSSILELKDTIIKIEILVGIRPPVITQEQKEKSKKLIESIEEFLDSNFYDYDEDDDDDKEAIDSIIARIDEAIKLDPNNTYAITFKDKVIRQFGRNDNKILDLPDKDIDTFIRAENFYFTGSPEIAMIIVKSMLEKNPNYINFYPLYELYNNLIEWEKWENRQ